MNATPAIEWVSDWEPHLVQVGSNRYVSLRRLSLTQELLAGTLPNPLLDVVLGLAATVPLQRNATTLKQSYQIMASVAARAMVAPRLMLPSVLKLAKQTKPDPAKGQIGLEHLHWLHLQRIYHAALDLVQPGIDTLPYSRRARFGWDSYDAEKLSRMAAQAERQHVAPSHYLGLNGSDFSHWREAVGSEVAAFWAWAIDDMCDYALIRIRDAARQPNVEA